MTAHHAGSNGDTWLTRHDIELLHALADALPAQVRRDLARTLCRAGSPPRTGQPIPATEPPPSSG
ncbi:MAG TPA: hypothetical protein VFX70_22515 [Mycobacteriales bacterium]|nr:hypothetical protein [Mycobacteriales bacterium]